MPAATWSRATYDSQGNVVQQRKYAQAARHRQRRRTSPTAPAGDVDVVDRIYDTANRLIEEISPNVKVGETPRRPTCSSASAPPTATTPTAIRSAARSPPARTDAATEHYYYDAINQRVAVVTAGRTLNTFKYDANGNRTELSRYFDALPDTVDLAQATPRHAARRGHRRRGARRDDASSPTTS